MKTVIVGERTVKCRCCDRIIKKDERILLITSADDNREHDSKYCAECAIKGLRAEIEEREGLIASLEKIK